MENGITWGYARISSMTQHEDRQIKKLKEFGVEERNIFVQEIHWLSKNWIDWAERKVILKGNWKNLKQ